LEEEEENTSKATRTHEDLGLLLREDAAPEARRGQFDVLHQVGEDVGAGVEELTGISAAQSGEVVLPGEVDCLVEEFLQGPEVSLVDGVGLFVVDETVL